MRFIDKTILVSEITPKAVFENRRNIIKTAAAGGFGMALAPWFSREALAATPERLAATINPAFADKMGSLHISTSPVTTTFTSLALIKLILLPTPIPCKLVLGRYLSKAW